MSARVRREVMALTMIVACVSLALVACTQEAPVSGCRPEAVPAGSVPSCPAVMGAPDRHPDAVIPDDQVVVPVSPPGAGFVVSVPRGWRSSRSATETFFTDGANTIRLEIAPRATPPTVGSEESRTAFSGGGGRGTASEVLRTAGPTILVRFAEQLPVDPATGVSAGIVIERYQFWRAGRLAVLTFISPRETDNTRFWRTVSDSFAWSP